MVGLSKSVMSLATIILLVGCDSPTKDEFYQVTRTTDPITDAETISAEATLRSDDGLNVSTITWSCALSQDSSKRNKTKLTFASFKPAKLDGIMEPAPFQDDKGANSVGVPIPIHQVKVRVENQEPVAVACTMARLDIISEAYAGVETCEHSNTVTVDPHEQDIGIRRLPDGSYGTGGDRSITYQHVVGGITYNYVVPYNEQIQELMNTCHPVEYDEEAMDQERFGASSSPESSRHASDSSAS